MWAPHELRVERTAPFDFVNFCQAHEAIRIHQLCNESRNKSLKIASVDSPELQAVMNAAQASISCWSQFGLRSSTGMGASLFSLNILVINDAVEILLGLLFESLINRPG